MKSGHAILLGQGLGALKFGANREEVRGVLGEPDSIKRRDLLEDGFCVCEIWRFVALGLEATFDQDDDWRLGSLGVSTQGFSLEGEELLGQGRPAVLALAQSCGWGDPVIEPMGEDPEQVAFEAVRLTLVFHCDALDSIQWGFFWQDENTPDWPD